MKESIAKKWAEALRSGDYKQDTKYLQTPNGYCCLGVLCELAIKDGIPIEKYRGNNVFYFDNQLKILPDSVAEWAGLNSFSGMLYKFLDEGSSLADLNDRGVSFSQIAGVIEGQWRHL